MLSLLHKEEVTSESNLWHTSKVAHASVYTVDISGHLWGFIDSAKRCAYTIAERGDIAVPCSLGYQCLDWSVLVHLLGQTITVL